MGNRLKRWGRAVRVRWGLASFVLVSVLAISGALALGMSTTSSFQRPPANRSAELVAWAPDSSVASNFSAIADSPWDPNSRFQVAGATTVNNSDHSVTPLAVGERHSCAVMPSGIVECWGANEYGQLGDGTTNSRVGPVVVSGLSHVVSVAVGQYHSCALTSTATVWCWGGNGMGQLGVSWSTTQSASPVQVVSIDSATSIALGYAHSCASLSSGLVKCWGEDSDDELGTGVSGNRSWQPVSAEGVSTAVKVAGGGGSTCALLSSGQVTCWGANGSWDLAPWREGSWILPHIQPVTNAIDVSYGGTLCALISDGTVSCWGSNEYRTVPGYQYTHGAPISTIPGVTDAVSVSTGYHHVCVLRSTGEVLCWGYNAYGQAGQDNYIQYGPAAVPGISSARAVSAGAYQTCAILADSTVKCWGRNDSGQLGAEGGGPTPITPQGLSAISIAPVPAVQGNVAVGGVLTTSPGSWSEGVTLQYQWRRSGVIIEGATSAKYTLTNADAGHAISVVVTGTKIGFNPISRESASTDMVTGGSLVSSNPVISGDTSVGGTLVVSAEGWDAGTDFTYEWTREGRVIPGASSSSYVLTDSDFAKLIGIRVTGSKPGFIPSLRLANAPKRVGGAGQGVAPGSSFAAQVAVGDLHTCALQLSGKIQCVGANDWGGNPWGQLGNGSSASSTSPVLVDGISTASWISSTGYSTCAVLFEGKVKCWGHPGLAGWDYYPTPIEIEGVNNAVQVSVGSDNTCALLSDATITCWGGMNMREGWGRLKAVPVRGVAGAVSISTGGMHACALLIGGSAQCWGDNHAGQLGIGRVTDYSWNSPSYVSGLGTAKSIKAGYVHTCAVLEDDSVTCWGANNYGAVGAPWPEGQRASGLWAVGGLGPVSEVIPGTWSTCAVLADTSVRCWGAEYGVDQNLWSPDKRYDYPGLRGVVSLAIGSHRCALLVDGSVRCWGPNTKGQLGSGTTTASSTPVLAVGFGDSLSQPPTPLLSGDPTVGSTLKIESGVWDQGVALSYRWFRDDQEIPGESSQELVLTQRDAGHQITAEVAGSKPGNFTVTQKSVPTNMVTGGTIQLAPTPIVAGETIIGSQLTSLPGAWDDRVSFAHQWKRSGVEISGATESTYQLGQADAGHTITVVVTGSKPGYTSVSTESAATEMVTGGTLQNTPVPAVQGDVAVGYEVTATPGTWDSGVSFTYAWSRDGVPIPGATSSTYAVTGDDVSHQLTVAVTGSKPGFYPVTVASSAIVPIAKTTAAVNLAVPVMDSVEGYLSLALKDSGTASFDAPQVVNNQSITVGHLPKIEVSDGRVHARLGWDLSATVDDFVNEGDHSITIANRYLGIAPNLVSATSTAVGVDATGVATVSGGTVAGSAVYPATIASAASGFALNSVVLDGTLRLVSPQEKPAGRYNSTLRLTAISK
jgi:alpha-tubulin suppressor-like RCC1 family protein